MNELRETLKTASNEMLWALTADIAALMEIRKYRPDKNDTAFMYWYKQYKLIEAEINGRMLTDYMEG